MSINSFRLYSFSCFLHKYDSPLRKTALQSDLYVVSSLFTGRTDGRERGKGGEKRKEREGRKMGREGREKGKGGEGRGGEGKERGKEGALLISGRRFFLKSASEYEPPD